MGLEPIWNLSTVLGIIVTVFVVVQCLRGRKEYIVILVLCVGFGAIISYGQPLKSLWRLFFAAFFHASLFVIPIMLLFMYVRKKYLDARPQA